MFAVVNKHTGEAVFENIETVEEAEELLQQYEDDCKANDMNVSDVYKVVERD